MTKSIKREFSKVYNAHCKCARELCMELLWSYKHTYMTQQKQKAIEGVLQTLYTIDMSYWRDDTSPDQIIRMIHEIEKYLVIIKSAGSNPAFLILEEKVNTAFQRCIDVLAA